jgi:POT family proton-dependent oligopeptide transporter
MFDNLLPAPDGAVLSGAALLLGAVCLASLVVLIRNRRAGAQRGRERVALSAAPDRHPRALYLLGLVQLWERFAVFAALPLFVLYLEQHRGLSTEQALLLFGLLQALSYLSGLPGGMLTDRWLGARRSTLLGTVLLMLGYAALSREHPAMLWVGLGLLVAGHGLFKPGLNAMAGALYAPGDSRRERGFLRLHVIFNGGTVLAPAVAEWARARGGWATVFQVAAVAMLASLLVCVLAGSMLRTAPCVAREPGPAEDDALTQRARIRACWLIAGVGVVFWLTAAQPTTSLTLFAVQNTERTVRIAGRALTVAPGHFMSLHALLVLLLTGPLSLLLARGGPSGAALSTPAKIIWGFVMTSAAFALMALASLRGGDASRVGLGWLGGCYVLLTLGELLLAPMGLALVTRLAPRERSARLVAVWFAAVAVGNGLAGALGPVWTRWPHHRYFALLAALALLAAAVLLVRLGRLERLLADERGSYT